MLVYLLVLTAWCTVATLGRDHEDDQDRYPTPPDWSTFPPWGTQQTGQWGAPGTGVQFGNPQWGVSTPNTGAPSNWGTPGPFYGQNPIAPLPAPPGMFYPPNWHPGGFGYTHPPAYPLVPAAARPDRMAVDDDSARPTAGQLDLTNRETTSTDTVPNHDPDNLDQETSNTDKGKKRASAQETIQHDEEIRRYRSEGRRCEVDESPIPREVLNIAQQLHDRDRIRDLEDHLRTAHESLAHALECARILECDLEHATRGTKRPRPGHRDEELDDPASKRLKQPAEAPPPNRRNKPSRIDDDSAIDGYLSESSRRTIGDAERRSSQARIRKTRKKEGSHSRQLTILPRRIEYLTQRGGTSYSRDSRVHPSLGIEESSPDDWFAFLTGTMGTPPIHPDTPRNTVPSNNLADDSDSDEDDEPRHIKWNRDNPVPKNAPAYKHKEREIFLKVEQAKFDTSTRNRALDNYNAAIARWESQPGRLPPSLPSVMIAGSLERDNGFWGMLGPGLLYVRKYNMVLANSEAVGAARALEGGRGFRPPSALEQRPNPRGFPMNIREMTRMVRDIRNRQPRWRNTLHLLAEFHRIASNVRLEYRDLSMQTAVVRLDDEWADVRAQFDTMDPPDFVPLPQSCITSNTRNANHGTGLIRPVNGTIDQWCRYIAHHMHPGGRSTPSGIGMDTSFQVSIPHTWGYLLSMALSPENDHRGARSAYSRLFAGIVARPHWYSLRMDEINSSNRASIIRIGQSTSVLECMEWDAQGRDLSEDDVIEHLAINGITQAMIDSTYPYGVTYIDRGLSTDSSHADFYSDIDQQRHELLDTYGIPPTIDAHQGWWYPDAHDVERIKTLRHVQDFEAPERRAGESSFTPPNRPIFDWFHVGEHYAYEWLAERPPLDTADPEPRVPSPRLNEDVVMAQNSNAGPELAPAGESPRQDGIGSTNASAHVRSTHEELDVGRLTLSVTDDMNLDDHTVTSPMILLNVAGDSLTEIPKGGV